MKTRLIAVLMIALMVLTVFSSLAVTAKSTSSTTQTQSITQRNTATVVVIYGNGGGAGVYDPYLVPLGLNRVWDETLFNVHDTKITWKIGNVGPNDITCSSVKSTLATEVNLHNVAEYKGGTCFAWLGVQFQIKGLSSPQAWALLSPKKKVEISATVDYTLSGNTGGGKSAGVTNEVNFATGADPTHPTLVNNIATLNIDKPGTSMKMSETQVKVKVTTTLDKLGTGTPGQCEITIPLYTSAFGSDASAEGVGNVIVHDIQLTWL